MFAGVFLFTLIANCFTLWLQCRGDQRVLSQHDGRGGCFQVLDRLTTPCLLSCPSAASPPYAPVCINGDAIDDWSALSSSRISSDMHLSLAAALGLVGSAVAQTVSSYISTESPIAKAGVLANIGPDGSLSSGAYVRYQTICESSFHINETACKGRCRHR